MYTHLLNKFKRNHLDYKQDYKKNVNLGGAYSTNRFIELGCKKLAVILLEEFIANLGIQQLVEEVDGMKLAGAFSTKYFPSIDEAEQWILENNG